MSNHLTESTVIRIAREHAERRVRLANDAERRGVRIVILHGTFKHLAIESHEPVAYTVDTDTCTCKRFRVWQCCDHLALLQSELGYGMSPCDVEPKDEDVQILDTPQVTEFAWDMRPSAMAAD